MFWLGRFTSQTIMRQPEDDHRYLEVGGRGSCSDRHQSDENEWKTWIQYVYIFLNKFPLRNDNIKNVCYIETKCVRLSPLLIIQLKINWGFVHDVIFRSSFSCPKISGEIVRSRKRSNTLPGIQSPRTDLQCAAWQSKARSSRTDPCRRRRPRCDNP